MMPISSEGIAVVYPLLSHPQVIYKPFEITSFALGLLLVFRTDASYERWKNGRSNWTSVISGSREVMRLVRP